MLQTWVLLLLSLPPRPSSLRVRAWRRLRALGAVPLRSSAYLLPHSPDRYEQFQWLAQEIQKDGGEATLLKVDRIENMKQADVIRLFQDARNADYAALTERYRRLLKGRRPRLAEELSRLARETDPLADIPFFYPPPPPPGPLGRGGAKGRGRAPPPPPPRGPHRLGVPHQALHRRRRRVSLRAGRGPPGRRHRLRRSGRRVRSPR